MEFINKISLGELAVGAGTFTLAVVTVFITSWQIKEARRVWDKEVERQYKSGLLNEFDRWVREVVQALNKDAYDAKKWFKRSKEQDYFDMKSELLATLLYLSDTGWFFKQKGGKSFERYKFKEKFEELFKKYGDCTNKLHVVVDPKSTEKEQDEELDCEVELLNSANKFYGFITEIREKEKIS